MVEVDITGIVPHRSISLSAVPSSTHILTDAMRMHQLEKDCLEYFDLFPRIVPTYTIPGG
jgi:hypothetical protein